jgi:hypothetical protein
VTDGFTIEELVRTSDAAAVRKRFDTRNIYALLALQVIFFIVAAIELGIALSRDNHVSTAVAAFSALLNVAMVMLLRDVYRFERARKAGIWGPARLMRDHLGMATVLYLLAQYLLLLWYSGRSGDWPAWAILFPFAVLGFRLLISDLVLLHVLLYLIGTGLAWLTNPRDLNEMTIALGVINGLALGIEIIASWQMRKETLANWSARREQAVDQLRMREELRYARDLQLSMLPESAPRLDWIELAGVSVPATEVGGDYFDYFVEGKRVAVVTGDVAGHGMASGILLAALRSGFTLLRSTLHTPSSVLMRLHDLVTQTSRRRMLATAAVVLFDGESRRAIIASAGHPPVLVRSNGTVRPIELFAPPLGVRLPVSIPQVEIDFRPGDLFVVHSDGIYEARNAAEESYGLDRLSAVVARHEGASAEALRDAIVRDVESFRGKASQADDVTVVVARLM